MQGSKDSMRVSFLHPATFKLDGGAMFGIIPKPLWEKKIKPDESNRILMSLRVPFIETENRKILIDTGIGDYHGEKFNQQFEISHSDAPLVSLLENLKLNPDEITDIILTHLHFDHVGGLGTVKEGKPTLLFPNATVHVHKSHFEYAQNPTLRDSGSFHSHFFMPWLKQYQEKSQLNLIEALEGEILPDVCYLTSFGHTPYMIHPIFQKMIYMADLTPMSHHIHIPWVMGYDIEPGKTVEYKEKFYAKILQDDLALIFEHDTEVVGAKLQKDEKGHYSMAQSLESQNKSIALVYPSGS